MSERDEPALSISESASLERGYRRLPSNRYFRPEAAALASPAG